jgi:hypothetical protein
MIQKAGKEKIVVKKICLMEKLMHSGHLYVMKVGLDQLVILEFVKVIVLTMVFA